MYNLLLQLYKYLKQNMEKSNPWKVDNHIDSPVESSITHFEDNFTTSVISDKLPDSAEYLATLGKKAFSCHF